METIYVRQMSKRLWQVVVGGSVMNVTRGRKNMRKLVESHQTSITACGRSPARVIITRLPKEVAA